MYCTKCGTQLPDDARFCISCGAPVDGGIGGGGGDFVRSAQDAFDRAEEDFNSEVQAMQRTFSQDDYYYDPAPGGYRHRLRTDRSLLVNILLSIITCGIYYYYFIYSIAQDVNIACEGDGERTGGLVEFILLSIITCGIYGWYWEYKLGNRLWLNAPRYGMTFSENGTTVLLWGLIGVFLCCIGPFVALHILIKNTNAICMGYNRANNL